MLHIARMRSCVGIKPISPLLCDACKGFISSQRAILSCFLFLSPHETDTCSHTYTHTHTETHTQAHNDTHWQQIPMKCLNMVNKRSAGEWKEKRNKKQISNEIITIQREGEIERQRKRGREGRVATMARNNRAASMEKERWWGGEGYLDNRAGDRSTMAAVFSIRHYLIDRVAGLIVWGGYFRAAFVWGSAIAPPAPPPPSLPPLLDPQLPESPTHLPTTAIAHPRPCRGLVILCKAVRACARVCARGQRAGLLCCLLFAFHQWRAKCNLLRRGWERQKGRQGEKKEMQEGDGCPSIWPHHGWPGTFSQRRFRSVPAVLWRLSVEHCACCYRLNRVIVACVSL